MLAGRSLFARSLPALLALAAGCSGAAPSATISGENDARRSVLRGLEQRVTLTPAEPTSGENVEIHSVITNRGSGTVTLASRICGLDLAGDLGLTFPVGIGMCTGHSMSGPLAPGASRESTEIKRVSAAPGTYTLRVRHALHPEMWAEMQVVVKAP
jgi:hypothetical protein